MGRLQQGLILTLCGLLAALSGMLSADQAVISRYASTLFTGAISFADAVTFNGAADFNGTTTLDGTTTASTPILIANGTVGAPSVAFTSEADGTGLGIYRSTVSTIGFSVNGTEQWKMAPQGFIPTTTLLEDLGDTSTIISNTYTASLQGARSKSLTESAATGYVTLTVANLTACAARISYTIFARDATNAQSVTGEAFVSAVANSSGTVTAAVLSDQHILNPVSSGTLSNTTTQTTAANAITVLANAASSLTQTVLAISYRVETLGGTCAVTGL